LLWSASNPCPIQARSEPPGCDARLPQTLLGSWLGFPRLSSLSTGTLSNLTVPAALFVSFLHLLPDSLGRVKSTACWVCTPPLLDSGSNSAARLRSRDSASSKEPVAGASFCASRWGATFLDFRQFPSRRFHLKVPDALQTSRHNFHFASGRCRPTACWVCTPPLLDCRPKQSRRTPFSHPDPTVTSPCGAFRLSAGGFPRERFLASCRQAFTSRVSGPRGPQ